MAEVSTPPQTGTPHGSEEEQNGGAAKAQEAAGQAKDAAQEKVQEVAGQAKEKAGEAKEQASGKLREQVDQRSSQAGEQVTTAASDLKSVGEELRKQGKDTPAKLADQAAERTERLGTYLSESDADKILSDVEDFARKQPWAVVAGGLVLGFAASRFLKASSSERYSSSRSSVGEIGSGSPSTGSVANGYSAGTTPPPAPETRVVATATDEGVEIR
jgi:gas vesicle protein